jgi:putative redox protein
MSVEITGKYIGAKKVELVHGPSGSVLVTEAPRDNGGEGRSFSPTDLVAAGLGACIVTTVAIVAERGGLNVRGMHMRVEKHMQHDPRRIGSVPVEIHLPKALLEHDRQKLERAALSCPVHHSLHPEIKALITFSYDVEGEV